MKAGKTKMETNTEKTVEQINLIQKLAKIRAIADVVTKDKKGYNYTYADITSILAKITAGMKKYGVSLIPSVVPGTANVVQNVVSNTKFTKTGEAYENKTTEMLFTAEMIFKWVNDENTDDVIEVPWFVTGSMSDPAQAMGAGLTYTTRQFLTMYFQIAQSDTDPDNYRTKQKEAEDQEAKAVTAGIIKEVDKIVRLCLADFPDKKEDMMELCKKYCKDAKYTLIKEPNLASKLLEDVKKFMGNIKGNN